LTEADVEDVPILAASTLKPPPVITPTSDFLWPSISTGESFFDQALASGRFEGGVPPSHENGDAGPGAAHSALDAWAKEEEVQDIDPEEGGWELDADGGEFHSAVDGEDAVATEEVDEDSGAGATPGPSETELWIRNNPLSVDHVAAGSFESAMQVCPNFIHCQS
jgi:coatomer protein complex subunit alpha (xenin)